MLLPKTLLLKENLNTAKELNKLQTNETVHHLLSMDNIILAQVHANTHVNKNDPNITVNGKHSNVHYNTHANYTRY